MTQMCPINCRAAKIVLAKQIFWRKVIPNEALLFLGKHNSATERSSSLPKNFPHPQRRFGMREKSLLPIAINGYTSLLRANHLKEWDAKLKGPRLFGCRRSTPADRIARYRIPHSGAFVKGTIIMEHMDSMQPAANKILIGVFGLTDYEQRLLRSVLSLTSTSGRKHVFALQDPSCGRCPDIAIIDPENAAANASLQDLVRMNQAAQPAQLKIWQRAPTQACENSLVRPLAPTKMLALLDKIATSMSQQAGPSSNLSNISNVAKTPQAANSAVAHNENKVPSPLPAMQKNATLSAIEMPQKTALRALVVDDSPTVRAKIEVELRPYGVIADCVMSGEQALHMLSKNEYDVVFLDIVLPGADGYEICRAIKHNPQTKRLPVIMLTSKSSPFDKIRGSLAGCSTYLTKPVDNATFHAVAERYLVAAEDLHAAQRLHQAIPAFA